MSLPRWVEVTYREMTILNEINPYTGRESHSYSTGKTLAEYHVEVLSRIPEEVFKFAVAQRKPKLWRAIRLKFRIKEDGVLFGWDVQEMDFRTPNGGIKYAMIGGDFLDKWPGSPFKPQDLIDMTKE
jgi:hypothetical protein